MAEQVDFPFLEVSETAERAVRDGGTIYQKWTCQGCGSRLTGTIPNALMKTGKCDCGHITDLVKTGCNYLLLMPLGAAGKRGLTAPPGDARTETRH